MFQFEAELNFIIMKLHPRWKYRCYVWYSLYAHISYANVGKKILSLLYHIQYFVISMLYWGSSVLISGLWRWEFTLEHWNSFSFLHLKHYGCASCFINFAHCAWWLLFVMAFVCTIENVNHGSGFLCGCVLCTNSNKASRFIRPDSSLVLVVGVVDNAGKLLSLQFIT